MTLQIVRQIFSDLKIQQYGISSPGGESEVELRLDDGAVRDLDGLGLPKYLRDTVSYYEVATEILSSKSGDLRYLIASGIPIVTAPDELSHNLPELDTGQFDFYDEVARTEADHVETSEAWAAVRQPFDSPTVDVSTFPNPISTWIDATYDSKAQWWGYQHLAPVNEVRALQIGGKGIHAVKLLLAGASTACLITPVLGEALCAVRLAERAGVGDRFLAVVGYGEALPFRDGNFDRIYCGGTLHHLDVAQALSEVDRVLSDGGKFAAIEPWRAPFYGIGTRVFGKREREVLCRPIDSARLDQVPSEIDVQLKKFGTFSRYPMLALAKLGIRPSQNVVWAIFTVDDLVASVIPKARSIGSSLCLTMSKSQTGS